MQAHDTFSKMMDDTPYAWLALLAGVVLLVGISVRLARAPGDTLGSWSKFFLVCLRLVIGWHFLVEGLDKLQSPTWSSEAYLREASGPLAPHFRELAGDRLRDALTVGADKSFPAELEIQWQAYLDAFSRFYELNDAQQQRAAEVMKKTKDETVVWLTKKAMPTAKPAPYPPPLTVEMTIPERLELYQTLQEKAAAIEAELPRFGEEKFDAYKTAKANLNKVRGDLKRDLDAQTLNMKKALRDEVLFEIARQTAPESYRKNLKPLETEQKKDAATKDGDTKDAGKKDTDKKDTDKKDTDKKDTKADAGKDAAKQDAGKKNADNKPADKKDVKQQEAKKTPVDPAKQERDWINNIRTVYGQIRLAQATLPAQTEKIFAHAYDKRLGDTAPEDPLPRTPVRPVEKWTLLDWSDAIVKYGLVAVGACLLVGFLTRTACLAGAGFLLMFFLAMPPLPWLPEGPRAEGHYLFINKNIIEMTALLALATMRTGRWMGLDGILQFLRPSRWRARPESGTVK